MLANYIPALKYGQKLDVTEIDPTGAATNQVIKFDGSNVVWGDETVSPGELALTNAHILVGNASNVAADVAVSGDISIDNTGLTAIASGVIVNADVSASAAIDYSKLAALTSGRIIVGSLTNVPTAVAMSGDATIVASGAITIANSAVTTAKIADTNVTLGKLALGITPSHVVKFAGTSPAFGGGGVTDAITVTGAAATDVATAVIRTSTNAVSIAKAVLTTNTLTITYSADPGASTTVDYSILRAAV